MISYQAICHQSIRSISLVKCVKLLHKLALDRANSGHPGMANKFFKTHPTPGQHKSADNQATHTYFIRAPRSDFQIKCEGASELIVEIYCSRWRGVLFPSELPWRQDNTFPFLICSFNLLHSSIIDDMTNKVQFPPVGPSFQEVRESFFFQLDCICMRINFILQSCAP